jgi:hypothetical protein
MTGRLTELKDKYKGNRAFIIGNGPSLANAPFDKMIGEYSFAVNRIALLFDKTKWRPTHYVHTTCIFDHPKLPLSEIVAVTAAAIESFYWDKYESHKVLYNYPGVYFIPVSHEGLNQPEDAEVDWWSDDITKRVCKFGSSMFASMQIAVYLGFNPLYVIGADGYQSPHGSGQPDPNHFHPQYHRSGSQKQKDFNNLMFARAHEIALINCKRLGVDLYDATQSEGLGVLPKVDLREVLT